MNECSQYEVLTVLAGVPRDGVNSFASRSALKWRAIFEALLNISIKNGGAID